VYVTATAINRTSADSPSAEHRPPNIVLFLADDLGYGDIGCYGQTRTLTPHIDALAAGGLKFSQFYTGSPVCAPARCVLMTGLHTGHAYIRGNDPVKERGDVWNFEKACNDPFLEGQRPIPASTVTVAELLKAVGYSTACIGKWGLGGPLTEGHPNRQGFDLFFGYLCQRQAHTYYPVHLWRNQEKVPLDNPLVVPGTRLPEGADPMDESSYAQFNLNQYAPDLMIEEALSFIDQNAESPFFLYYASPIPHVPLQAPKKWVDFYREKWGDEKPYDGSAGYFPARYPHATYAAMISYLDDQLGQIMAKLDQLGLRENTLVLFTSDNGPTYNGGSDSPFFDSARPFKSEYGWAKGFVHEGGIRVPMIASWPGRIAPGAKTDALFGFYDVLPSLCELTGAPFPQKTDGISFLPALLGDTASRGHEYLVWDYPEYGGQQAVRMGPWKGIRKDIEKGNLEIELFNLETDPREQANVANQNPGVVGKIEEIMRKEHVVSPVPLFRMKALGDPVEE
jgi:arylsulfatase